MSLTIPRRLTTLLVAALVAAFAILGLARPATAAPSPALPDGSRTATLHITKEQAQTPANPNSGAGNGTQQDPGNPPLAGVQFTLQQVNTIDLTTQAGWNSANTLSNSYTAAAPTDLSSAEAAVTGAGFTLSGAQTQTTAADGTANFANLPLGLYLVAETSTPAGVTPSAPFLVTLPLTDPDNPTSWMYDVYVYPKNAITGVTKTVQDDTAVKLGDPVTWTITGDIPASTGPGDTVSGYQITDQLDSKLTYTPTAVVTLKDGTALDPSDYTVSFDSATNTVKVLFTPAGLTVLSAHRDTQVQVQIATVVNAVGDIENVADLYPNKDAIDSDTGTSSPPVETKWGSVTVLKQNPQNAALQGATFKVYTSLADAQNDQNAVSINGTDTWTTGSDGTVTISGLRDSDWANGQSVNPGDPGYLNYYLVEVQAPSGYELNADPIPFTVTDATSTVGVDTTVTDVPSNGGFTLPFTGGTGSSLVYLTGILLIGGAGFIAAARRRRTTS